jgi:peroxiredoxin
LKIFCDYEDRDWYEEDSLYGPPKVVPSVIFKTRVRDDSLSGENPYKWEDKTSFDYFGGKKVLIFSLPGAFTPTCSTYQLPGFEKNYQKFMYKGIQEIYCISVNDAFVMNSWGKSQNVENVKLIADGSGYFTEGMRMLVKKDNLGFGERSWRYAAVVNNGAIETFFVEKGKEDNHGEDPYVYTRPSFVLENI